jgi:membrane protein DedA with SNARE-associated domain
METGQEIIRHISTLSYVGIFGISFIANVLVPVPEEVIILAMGYVAGTGAINFWITLGVVIVGSLLSDMGMFWLSRHDNKWVKGFYTKIFSRVFPVDHEFLVQHSNKVIFLARFLVQLRFLGPFIAGQVKVPWKKFIAYDLAALLIYMPGLMWAGHYFAKRIDSVFAGVNQVKNIIIVIAGIMILWSFTKMVRDYFLKVVKKPEK